MYGFFFRFFKRFFFVGINIFFYIILELFNFLVRFCRVGGCVEVGWESWGVERRKFGSRVKCLFSFSEGKLEVVVIR